MSIREMIAATMKELQLYQSTDIMSNRVMSRKVHDYLYKWIVDQTPSPKSISDLLNDLKLEPFFDNLGFQALVALTCLEGIAMRQPLSSWKHQVLEGSLEELLWNIVSYSDIIWIGTRYRNQGILSLRFIKQWLCDHYSPKQCPNPCLRLELFRFMSELKEEGNNVSRKALIVTLCEISDIFFSLKNKGIIKCSARDLKNIMESNALNIKVILDLKCPKQTLRIIVAVLKITNMYAVLEEQKLRNYHSDNTILLCCLDFCGLITNYIGDADINSFADIVCNNIQLQEYIADTLRLTKEAVVNWDKTQREYSKVIDGINRILGRMVSAEARLLPLRIHQLPPYLGNQELNGITLPIAHHLFYFTTIKNRYYSKEKGDYYYELTSDYSEFAYIQQQSKYNNFSESSDSSEDDWD